MGLFFLQSLTSAFISVKPLLVCTAFITARVFPSPQTSVSAFIAIVNLIPVFYPSYSCNVRSLKSLHPDQPCSIPRQQPATLRRISEHSAILQTQWLKLPDLVTTSENIPKGERETQPPYWTYAWSKWSSVYCLGWSRFYDNDMAMELDACQKSVELTCMFLTTTRDI